MDEIEGNEDAIEEYKSSLNKARLDQSTLRRFLYRDVEELITDGFLHNTIEVEGSVIAFRTLPNDRMSQLRVRCYSNRQRGDVLRWVLASSVWMVNGYEVFQDRNAPFHLFNEFFKDLRCDFLKVLSDAVWSLRKRVDQAVIMTESYCYEPYSRNLWYLQGKRPASEENPIRRIWEAHNISEDEFMMDMRNWEHTKAQVGSMSQKGAQHINREIERLKNKEEDRRQSYIRRNLQKMLYGQDWDGVHKVKINLDGKDYEIDHMESAASFDDLDQQMKRFVEGKKDAHDLIVERYMQDIQDRNRARKEEYERVASIMRENEDFVSGSSSTVSLVGYTPQQLEELGVNKDVSVKVESENSAVADHLYQKLMQNDIKAGWINSSGAPERYGDDSGAATLQDKISQRKPSLGKLNE